QKDIEVCEAWDYFLNTHHRDVYARQTRRQVDVAFVFDNHDCAGLGDREVDTTDADVRRRETIAQGRARGGGQWHDVVSRRHGEFRGAQLCDLPARFVNRGCDDVRRRFIR